VVALRAWDLLNAPERQEGRKQEQAGPTGQAAMDMAFFPLTMPFTTGPGTISVAVTLGAERPASGLGLLGFFLGVSGAAVAIAALVWVCYREADRVAGWLSASARRSASRLIAFLLLCLGAQIFIGGVQDVVASLR
jgi:multiple antibiotic resistance protein